VKAAISALDGVLAAEKEAGVSAGRVKFTVTWSFAMKESIDGMVRGPGIFGFQDMVAVIEDPQIAKYTPRTSLGEMQEAFRTRWVHGLNTQAPWNFVRDVISQDYSRFLPIPWFIGEYGGNQQDEDVIRADMESMQAHALGSDAFLGAAFFQFQTTYWKGGAEKNFGLFGLGEQQLGETGEVCEMGCSKWPVHCLTTNLSWLPGTKANRAKALASAWGGSIDHSALCPNERRLRTVTLGAKLACRIRAGAASDRVSVVAKALGTEAFSNRIINRTWLLLEGGGDALGSGLSLTSAGAWSFKEPSRGESSDKRMLPSWTLWALACALAVLVGVMCVVVGRRKSSSGYERSTAEQAV